MSRNTEWRRRGPRALVVLAVAGVNFALLRTALYGPWFIAWPTTPAQNHAWTVLRLVTVLLVLPAIVSWALVCWGMEIRTRRWSLVDLLIWLAGVVVLYWLFRGGRLWLQETTVVAHPASVRLRSVLLILATLTWIAGATVAAGWAWMRAKRPVKQE